MKYLKVMWWRRRRIVWLAALGVLMVALGSCSETSTSVSTAPRSSLAGGADATAVATVEPVETVETVETFPPDDPRIWVDAILLAPPEPIKLSTTGDDAHSVTQTIGIEGGAITTTDAAGTTYTLTVPPEAVGLPTAITLTPIASVTGFGTDPDPTNGIGASLGPEGLPLAAPATLEIKPVAAFSGKGLSAFSYRGVGDEAGFELIEHDAATATFSIEHFSGYLIIDGYDAITMTGSTPPALLRKFFTQTEIEARFASEVAYLLSQDRQRQELGLPSQVNQVELAKALLSEFKRLVISPRVAAADKGCGQAVQAMQAYLTYSRTRQLLGLGDDPSFDLVGAGLFVPKDLADLAIGLCFEEAYQRCALTGDFPSLVAFYQSFVHKLGLMGVEPSDADLASAINYLQRCGTWRVHITTSEHFYYVGGDPPDQRDTETSRAFEIQWHPGSGPLGLFGSKIDGHAQVDTLRAVSSGDKCTIHDVTSERDATAEIKLLEYDHYDVPVIGTTISTFPKKLTLAVDLGKLDWEVFCEAFGADQNSGDGFTWQDGLAIQELGIPMTPEIAQGMLNWDPVALDLDKKWQFSTEPFKAVLGLSGTLYLDAANTIAHDVRYDVIVAHEPK